jgi:AraC-like DNA-binding protein
MPHSFAPKPCAFQKLDAKTVLARHRHAEPYAALVLSGAYLEAGDAGRRLVEAGDVIFHARFEAHTNRARERGATILNLPLLGSPAFAFGILPDPDLVVRTAERDAVAAAQMMVASARPHKTSYIEWTDLLAESLRQPGVARLEDWAFTNGLSPSTLSRAFRRDFGVSPKRYQLELRTQWAIASMAGNRLALADIAVEAGFSDQAHMTRAVRALTGSSPSHLRSL